METKIKGFEIIKEVQELVTLISDIETHRITYNEELQDERIMNYKDSIIKSVQCL